MTTFDVRQALIDAYNNAPVEDHDRADVTECVGRWVLAESPAPWPRNAHTDLSVKLPIRVAVVEGKVELEVGPYDFGPADVSMLKQAIALYEYYGGETAPVEPKPKSFQSLKDRLEYHGAVEPVEDLDKFGEIVDLDAARNLKDRLQD
ncbi:hypothetical protein [Mycolicibacterium peregrinum]|uniref:hypothetical protein n=1 Tax=Mycolicibacterium peregrinum TaxID=43304 RepID=UPI003AABE986